MAPNFVSKALVALLPALALAEPASFTEYGSGDQNGSANCKTQVTACGKAAGGFTAAISQQQFGVGPGAGAGPGCYKCWQLTIQKNEAGQAVTPKTVTVTVDNLCPIQGNEKWCQVPNQFGAQVHFDLCKDSGAADAFFTNGESGTGTAVEVSCAGGGGGSSTPPSSSSAPASNPSPSSYGGNGGSSSSSAAAAQSSSAPAYSPSSAAPAYSPSPFGSPASSPSPSPAYRPPYVPYPGSGGGQGGYSSGGSTGGGSSGGGSTGGGSGGGSSGGGSGGGNGGGYNGGGGSAASHYGPGKTGGGSKPPFELPKGCRIVCD